MQSDGNRLVECQECHGLYHQECHQPPINETEIPVNDPRLAWYCAACKKKLNKAVCEDIISDGTVGPHCSHLPLSVAIFLSQCAYY